MGAVQNDGCAGDVGIGGEPKSCEVSTVFNNVVAFLYSP
jgi:hypothetical protein